MLASVVSSTLPKLTIVFVKPVTDPLKVAFPKVAPLGAFSALSKLTMPLRVKLLEGAAWIFLL